MRSALGIFLIALPLYPQQVSISAGNESAQEQDQKAREQYSRLTRHPERDPWQMPAQVVAALGLKPSEVVATFGDADGYFSRRIGAQAGQVLVVGTDAALLAAASKEAPASVVTIAGTVSGLTSRAGLVDTIFVCDTLGHTPDHVAFFQSLSSALKANGRLIVIDFYKGGPPPGLSPAQQITEASVTKELNSVGFHLVQRFDFLPYQFFVVFQH